MPPPTLDPRPSRRLDRGMKVTLFALFVALLMVGCGEGQSLGSYNSKPNQMLSEKSPMELPVAAKVELDDTETLSKNLSEALEFRKIEWRNEGTLEVQRGAVVFAIGKETPYNGWVKDISPNGRARMLGQYKNGLPDGVHFNWFADGKMSLEAKYKSGELDGIRTRWYKNGLKKEEFDYKYGKLMSAKVWKPSGMKCDVTNINEGNGVYLVYSDEGSRNIRFTYKDGEKVED